MARFELGKVCVTCGVNSLMADNSEFARFVKKCFSRFMNSDWGDMCEADKQQNEEALKHGDNRLFAAYEHAEKSEWRLWIITEWDHSATTALFPSEY
jgi:hypothetical protein